MRGEADAGSGNPTAAPHTAAYHRRFRDSGAPRKKRARASTACRKPIGDPKWAGGATPEIPSGQQPAPGRRQSAPRKTSLPWGAHHPGLRNGKNEAKLPIRDLCVPPPGHLANQEDKQKKRNGINTSGELVGRRPHHTLAGEIRTGSPRANKNPLERSSFHAHTHTTTTNRKLGGVL